MKKILIVDDDKITRKVLSRLLKPYSKQYKVLTAEDGTDAVMTVSTNKVDLVLTDIQMDIMDGLELIVYLKKNHPETPIITMTAFDDPEAEAEINSSGVLESFRKPLDMDKVLGSIRKELGE